jgi:hypothetical protein
LLIKSDRTEGLHRFVGELLRKMGKEAMGVQMDVDVDPINLM